MGMHDGVEEPEPAEEFEPDPRECRFELPPMVGRPFADAQARARAVRRVVEQAERERSSGTDA